MILFGLLKEQMDTHYKRTTELDNEEWKVRLCLEIIDCIHSISECGLSAHECLVTLWVTTTYDRLRPPTTGKSQVVTAESSDRSHVVTGSRTTDCGRGQVFGHVQKPGYDWIGRRWSQVGH